MHNQLRTTYVSIVKLINNNDIKNIEYLKWKLIIKIIWKKIKLRILKRKYFQKFEEMWLKDFKKENVSKPFWTLKKKKKIFPDLSKFF